MSQFENLGRVSVSLTTARNSPVVPYTIRSLSTGLRSLRCGSRSTTDVSKITLRCNHRVENPRRLIVSEREPNAKTKHLLIVFERLSPFVFPFLPLGNPFESPAVAFMRVMRIVWLAAVPCLGYAFFMQRVFRIIRIVLNTLAMFANNPACAGKLLVGTRYDSHVLSFRMCPG